MLFRKWRNVEALRRWNALYDVMLSCKIEPRKRSFHGWSVTHRYSFLSVYTQRPTAWRSLSGKQILIRRLSITPAVLHDPFVQWAKIKRHPVCHSNYYYYYINIHMSLQHMLHYSAQRTKGLNISMSTQITGPHLFLTALCLQLGWPGPLLDFAKISVKPTPHCQTTTTRDHTRRCSMSSLVGSCEMGFRPATTATKNRIVELWWRVRVRVGLYFVGQNAWIWQTNCTSNGVTRVLLHYCRTKTAQPWRSRRNGASFLYTQQRNSGI